MMASMLALVAISCLVHGTPTGAHPNRRLLQVESVPVANAADVTPVTTAAELLAALQQGRPHIRVTEHLVLDEARPAAATAAAAEWTINSTESIVGDCGAGGQYTNPATGASVPLRAGQCAVRAGAAVLTVQADNLWLHNLLLLPAEPAPDATPRSVLRHSRGRLWATMVDVRGSDAGWIGAVISIAAHPHSAYFGNMTIADIGAAAAAIETSTSLTLRSVRVLGVLAPPQRGLITLSARSGTSIVRLFDWESRTASAHQFAVADLQHGTFFRDTVEIHTARVGRDVYVISEDAHAPLFALEDADLEAEKYGVDFIDADSEWLLSTQQLLAPAPIAPAPPPPPRSTPMLPWLLPTVFVAAVLVAVAACMAYRQRFCIYITCVPFEGVEQHAVSRQLQSSPAHSMTMYFSDTCGILEPAEAPVLPTSVSGDGGVSKDPAAVSSAFMTADAQPSHSASVSLDVTEPSHDSDSDANRPWSSAGNGSMHFATAAPAAAPQHAHPVLRDQGSIAAMQAVRDACVTWFNSRGTATLRFGLRYELWLTKQEPAEYDPQRGCLAYRVNAGLIDDWQTLPPCVLRYGRETFHLPCMRPDAGYTIAMLRVFADHAAFERFCASYAHDHSVLCGHTRGAEVLAPLYAVHDADPLAASGSDAAPQERLLQWPMALSLYTTAVLVTTPPVADGNPPPPQAQQPPTDSGINRLLRLSQVIDIVHKQHTLSGRVLLTLSPASIHTCDDQSYLGSSEQAKARGTHVAAADLIAHQRRAGAAPLYTPPEIYAAAQHGAAVDVDAAVDRWALGVLTLHICALDKQLLEACPATLRAAADDLRELLEDVSEATADRVQQMARGNKRYPWEFFPDGKQLAHHAPQDVARQVTVALGFLQRDPATRIDPRDASTQLTVYGV
eukprot:jgi/Ulvmu1/5551/UM023_0087.1